VAMALVPQAAQHAGRDDERDRRDETLGAVAARPLHEPRHRAGGLRVYGLPAEEALQVRFEVGGGLVSLVRILLERLLADRREVARDLVVQALRLRRLLEADLVDDLLQVLA